MRILVFLCLALNLGNLFGLYKVARYRKRTYWRV